MRYPLSNPESCLFRICRSVIVGLLVLAMSHAPIPLVHQHGSLSVLQLEIHARDFHSNCPNTALPQGWHFHFFYFSADSGQFQDSPGLTVSESGTRLTEQLCSNTNRSSSGDYVLINHGRPTIPAFAGAHFLSPPFGQHIYKVFKVLLL